MNKFLKWTPRIISILFIVFLSLFSFDVFVEEYTVTEMMVGFIMHNVPTFLLIITLTIAWKKPKIGGMIFVFLSLLSIIFFKTYEDFIVLLMISLPPFIVGSLFIYDSIRSKK